MKRVGILYPQLDKSVLSVGWVSEPDEPAYWHAKTFDERWQAIENKKKLPASVFLHVIIYFF